MGISPNDLLDLFKITFDSAPPELKAQMAAMMEQLKQERYLAGG